MPALTASQAFASALDHHRAGRLLEAENLYRGILAQKPDHAEAMHFLGVIAQQVGRNDLAVDWIRRAVEIDPGNAVAHSNLGEAYRKLGQLEAAVESYRIAERLQSNHPETYNNLGLALIGQGNFAEAVAAFRRALQLRPDWPETLNRLGGALSKEGQFGEAIGVFRRAVELKPDFAEAQNNLGGALIGLGRLDDAAEAYRLAIQLNPRYAMAHYNLGMALAKLERTDEAKAAYHQALEIQPDYPDVLTNLGDLLRDEDRIDEAVAYYERSLAIDPKFSRGYLNVGVIRLQQARFAEAEAAYRRAIDSEADLAHAHFNLGLLELLLGRYEEGWREYEWRWRGVGRDHVRKFSRPLWNGQAVPGKTLFIHTEQGYGDGLLMTRYLPLVCERAQAARVILECRPGLKPLLEQLAKRGIEVASHSEDDAALPDFDVYVPMFGLPQVLENFAPVPPLNPALEADAELRAQWRERLGATGKKRVGLAWEGSPLQNDNRNRSMAPEKLAPLLGAENVEFVSLQVEPRGPLPEILVTHGVRDVSDGIRDFADSAALFAELDLIITVDTATAHLAATLGRPTWVMLSRVPYWPYGLESETTPWYPTMRLFRQKAWKDWEPVVERVTAELNAWKG